MLPRRSTRNLVGSSRGFGAGDELLPPGEGNQVGGGKKLLLRTLTERKLQYQSTRSLDLRGVLEEDNEEDADEESGTPVGDAAPSTNGPVTETWKSGSALNVV